MIAVSMFVFFIIIGLLAVMVMVYNVYKGKFSEKESFFWVIAALLMITLPLYIELITKFSLFVGIVYPPSMVFAVVILFIFFLMFRLSSALYKQNERIVELVQLNAIYENELREIKRLVQSTEGSIEKK